MKKKIGCLGPEASNSYEVAKAINYAGDELIPLSSFELIKSLKSGEIQKAILPIENSIEGRVKWVFDFLAGNNLGLLSIIGEDIWKVRHCLIGFGKESEIKMVYSHPQALGQCRISMGSLDLKDADSTSAAVKFIAESQQKTLAAIGTRQAAERYKVPIIKEEGHEKKYPKDSRCRGDEHRHAAERRFRAGAARSRRPARRYPEDHRIPRQDR